LDEDEEINNGDEEKLSITTGISEGLIIERR
jgi:hypothetical protein